MMKKIGLLFASALLLTIVSCNKKDPEQEKYYDYVVVLNQGNYSDQSGSISLYSEDENSVINRVFETANDNMSIGAIIMGGDFAPDGRLFALCSNPDKIMVINPYTMGLISVLNDSQLSSTRDIKADDRYIYVTNYGTDYIVDDSGWEWEYINSYLSIYNSSTLEFIDTVHVGSDAEGILLSGNEVYVATKQGVTVVTIDPEPRVVAKISDAELGAAKYLVKNYESGAVYASFPSYGIAEISTSQKNILKKYRMEVDFDGFIAINSDYSKIYSFYTTFDQNWNPASSSINELTISTGTTKKVAEGDYFYSIGINPFSDNIYASEVSFTSNSTLEVFNKNGQHVDSHAVGIGTYKYLFMRL